jgi:hypothetical protein
LRAELARLKAVYDGFRPEILEKARRKAIRAWNRRSAPAATARCGRVRRPPLTTPPPADAGTRARWPWEATGLHFKPLLKQGTPPAEQAADHE